MSFKGVALILFALLLNTCSGEVENVAECSLDCGKSINAVSGVTITALNSSVTASCTGNSLSRAIEVYFRVESDGSSPRPAIGFKPIFTGTFDPRRNDQTETEFKGIETLKDQWCSSSCGMVKLRLWPGCEQGETLNHTLILVSGSIVSDEVSITTESTEGE